MNVFSSLFSLFQHYTDTQSMMGQFILLSVLCELPIDYEYYSFPPVRRSIETVY